MSATRSHHDSASTKKPTSTIYETIMPPVTSSRKLRETLRQNEKDTLPTSPEVGFSKAVVISSSIVAFICVIAVILVIVVIVRRWKTIRKRRRGNNIRTVRSNTQLSFDNLSYVGEGRRRDSVHHEVDMTDFEIMRTRVVTSIKRKVSAALSTKSKDQDKGTVSCGRLSIIETKYENSTLDLGEIVQTFQV